MPDEARPNNPDIRFARGVWDGDSLPETDMGCNITSPALTLSLEPMELGLSENGEPSWTERMLELRDTFGPFYLTYLEALLRAADMRVSMKAQQS